MIRINLLPVRAKKKRNTSIYQLVALGGVLMVALVTAFTVHAVFQNQVEERRDQTAADDHRRGQRTR